MRTVGLFVALLLLLASLLAGAVYWVGPKLVDLALFDPARQQPYLLLDFARGVDAERFDTRYQTPLSGLVASEGGVHLGGYRLSHLITGRREDGWQYLNHFHMARAQDVVQIMTASPYRVLTGHTPDLTTTQLGGYAEQPPRWGHALVVWFVDLHEQSSTDPLVAVLEVLDLGTGRVVWDAGVDSLSEPDVWERLLVVEFDTEQAAMAWLRHTSVVTARNLANANARHMAAAVYTRAADALTAVRN